MRKKETALMLGVMFVMLVPLVSATNTPNWDISCDSNGNLIKEINNYTINDEVYNFSTTIENGCNVMPLGMFVMFEIIAFGMFVIAVFRKDEIIFSLSAMVLFFLLSVFGASVEGIPMLPIMNINMGFGIITFVYLFYQVFYILKKSALQGDDE